MSLITRAELDQGFYVRRSYSEVLMLNAVERDVYAIIRSFTENGEYNAYLGTPRFLTALTGKAKSTINTALRELIARGLIYKRKVSTENGERNGLIANVALEKSLINKYISAKEASASDIPAGAEEEDFPALGEGETEISKEGEGEASKKEETWAKPENKEEAQSEEQAEAQGETKAQGDAGKEDKAEPRSEANSEKDRGAAAEHSATDDKDGEAERGERGERRAYYGRDSARSGRRDDEYRPKSRTGCYMSPEDAQEAMRIAFLRTYGEDG